MTEGDGSGRVNLTIKAVLVYDDKGNYFIHGCNEETAQEMLQKMQPLWGLDPTCETARYVEFVVSVPEIETLPTVRVYHACEHDKRS